MCWPNLITPGRSEQRFFELQIQRPASKANVSLLFTWTSLPRVYKAQAMVSIYVDLVKLLFMTILDGFTNSPKSNISGMYSRVIASIAL